MKTTLLTLLLGATLCVASLQAVPPENLRDENVVAWCIVPFDGKKRGPAARAEMLKRLGVKRVAYDWRAEHVPQFEEEIQQYKKHGIEFFAFWGEHNEAFRLFEKYDLHPQIWKTMQTGGGSTEAEKTASTIKAMEPLAKRTAAAKCQLGLYNHGGWGGEPANMIAVCKGLHDLGYDHVGIVYNLHHGHGHIDDFAAVLKDLKPYLFCLNLNGMTDKGDQIGKKILPLGAGERDVELLSIIKKSGYDGPIGIIGHTQDDVELRLSDNLDGLHWMLPQIEGKAAGKRPAYRTWRPAAPKPPSPAATSGALLEGRKEYRQPPLTVECRATLTNRSNYNILIANDIKSSGDHWEVFSMKGSGTLTAYLPGCKPDHVRSKVMVCDGKPHAISMIYEANRVRLLVDGKQAADQKIERLSRKSVPGKLAIGRLVEGHIGMRGTVEWVRISRGVREIPSEPVLDVKADDATLLLWRSPPSDAATSQNVIPKYSPQVVAKMLKQVEANGDPHRGLLVFASMKTGCISCHKVGKQGSDIGPALTLIGKQTKPAELIESVVWPKRHVKPEFSAHRIIDAEGRSLQGYIIEQNDQQLVLLEPGKGAAGKHVIAIDDIEAQKEIGTLMPDNLVAAMTPKQLHDLLKFLTTLGGSDGIDQREMDSLLLHAQMHSHGPATFPIERTPLQPEAWPNHQHHVNRDRLYDFYAKQAMHFKSQETPPSLLAEFPGLDGGSHGHWGNQNDDLWRDARWNETKLGSVQAGVFRGAGATVRKGVCVRLGGERDLAVCFNPETLSYDAVWSGGFVKFAPGRHGFLNGLAMDGKPLPAPKPSVDHGKQTKQYLGYYRIGDQVIFAYRIGDTEWLDAPVERNGRFVRIAGPAERHPLANLLTKPKTQWPERLETSIEFGDESPYAVDTINLPFDNPWNALLFCGGHAFLPDGSALICTMQGDVWRVTDFAYPSRKAVWKRYASGLHQALGIVADKEGVFVLGRDQITKLHDRNNDGEADFYECFSNAYTTSPSGHDFICGLQRDKAGAFYTASSNQGLLQIAADGKSVKTLATGFRNPDGIGLSATGKLTVPCSEGGWTPASMICETSIPQQPNETKSNAVPYFGYGGPRKNQPPALPLVYLPRGLDNSSGGQTFVEGGKWGPLDGQMLHFSFGMGTHFLVLRDEVNGQPQGAVVPLPGDFRSGVHRGRFRPQDGQLYVTGMQGWVSFTPDDGCFQRVRYAGGDVQLPINFQVHENGVRVEFSLPIAEATVTNVKNHFAQCWNYRYGPGYGSPEFSAHHFGMRGHDVLPIRSTHIIDDHTIFLEIPDLQPVNQLHLLLQPDANQDRELFITVHQLDKPFTDFNGYQPQKKTIQPHPLIADITRAANKVLNPHRKPIQGARKIRIETGPNLSFATRLVRVKAGEPIAFALANPDAVPHNWVLVNSGALEAVGELSNHLISDPDAAAKSYIPQSNDVLAFTDVVWPKEEFTIYFEAPTKPGRYPFLCTFPGHWKVMNGVMIVE